MVCAPDVFVQNGSKCHVSIGTSDWDKGVGGSTPLARGKLVNKGAGIERYAPSAHFIQRGELDVICLHKCGRSTVDPHFESELSIAVLVQLWSRCYPARTHHPQRNMRD